ncbi:RidA family protein [Falsirhodobacter algicola]|uniref:RidA family protein n=1 Tax=Falsirhodobacter algicola TaxID=2692330 RepID=A0A8J8MTA8_9RHOB|nr:RidA family protein [Falsirhodobacter algicola]QUS36302.1 RidA family protein [Falsirhodobacter algicola]
MTLSLSRMNPTSLPDAGRAGYSQITVVPPGPLAFVSGQVAWRRDGGPVPGDIAEQADIVIENLSLALTALNARPDRIVQMRIYMTDLHQGALDSVMAKIGAFLDGAQPSLTGVGVTALAAPDLKLEVEMVVSVPA